MKAYLVSQERFELSRLSTLNSKSSMSANSITGTDYLAGRVGLEPTAFRLTAECSAIELPTNVIKCIICILNINAVSLEG